MSAPWRDDEDEFRAGGAKGGSRSKPRFSFTEVKLLLEAVKRNRYILLKKFNQGVSAETKKQTWTEITNQINGLGENHREVRQIMKKWADLKCDGRRRFVALRGPSQVRKKNMGPVERMVHKILMMSPRGGGDSDLDLEEGEDFSKLYGKGPAPNQAPFSYLSLTDSSQSIPGGGGAYDFSPLSSPEKDYGGDLFHSSPEFDLADDGDCGLDFEENDDSMFSSYPSSLPPPSSTSLDPLPDNALLRMKPVHTYSRTNSQNHNPAQNHTSPRPPPGPSSSVASTSSGFPAASDPDTASSSAPPPPTPPTSSNVTASSLPTPSSSFAPPPAPSSSANPGPSNPAPPPSSIPPPPLPPPPAAVSSSPVASTATSSSNSQPSPFSSALSSHHLSASGSNPADPLPSGVSPRRAHDHVAQMASQSLQQQRASRMLLTSVSQSLEVLAQSVQLLVESQQEFVQESLLLQRETVDVLRDFSNTALTMLRDKTSSGQMASHHHPAAHF